MQDEPREQHLVFISHSGADTWVARQIARNVELCGAIPFLDEANVEVGEDFEEGILSFLEKAHELLVLLTPWALDRPYVWAEIGAAWGKAHTDCRRTSRHDPDRTAIKTRCADISKEARFGGPQQY